ncbi:IS701 family transposase [Streptomyces fenghuangensis]|uniref:IS701 family transposase n=1 Tax=Streptomyces chitinivorans TaxID=1257027 RepID=A0ABW7HYW0_9ACTN|nr:MULTISPECIES: transposase [Streptomyces]MCG3040411.1 transposase [Streptomyces sp. ICN903]MDH2410426.1 transposase [Streptomyces chitinivorans]
MSSLPPTSADAPVPPDQFPGFVDRVFAHLQRADQRRWGHAYLLGLLTTPGKKTVRRLAAAVTDSPTASQSLQQFVNSSPWEWEPVRHEVARWAEERLRPRAWTIATTVLPKRGDHSCGVHRRFVPRLGQTVNCQVGVGLFLSDGGSAVSVDWRLHLPARWMLPHLRQQVRIPDDIRPQPVWSDAFDMVDRLRRHAGVTPLPLVADLRDGRRAGDLVRLLARQRNDFVVAVSADFPVLPLNAAGRAPYSPTAPGIRHGLPSAGVVRAGSVVGGCLRGTHLNAGAPADLVHLTAAATPGVRERRVYRLFTDRRRPSVVWITNMVRHRAAELSSLVGCWTGTADAVRDLRQDFGLLDFEGRSYPGWHHYMTLVAAAHAYRTLLGSPPRSPARELEPVPA